MARTILHLHIPAFAIALARVSRPDLRGRPVAVAPPQSERALLLSVSAEARREGLHKGMPLGKARKRCPDLRVLPPDTERAENASRLLGRAVSRYTPRWEPARPGHIYLDVTGTRRLWGRAKDTGDRLRREVRERFALTANVGLSGNKMVASIASRRAKGLLNVDHGEEARFLAPLPVGVIPGIGRSRSRILLEELNVLRVRQLAALDPGRLTLIFGRRAAVIHQRSMGIDPTPVYPNTERPLFQEDIMLTPDENDDQRVLGALHRLLETCARRLRRQALFPRKAGVLIRYADRIETRRRITLPRPSTWDFDLYPPLQALFFKICTRRVRIRFLRVWFEDLAPHSGQLPLFPADPPENENPARVVRALDRIRERYGHDAIAYGAWRIGSMR